MPPLVDLSGQRFGRLLIVDRAESVLTSTGHARTCWSALCDCGRRVVVRGAQLQSGRTRSCGCLHLESVTRNGARRRETVGYKGAHIRLRKVRGAAADYPCDDCGGPADQWSYRGACPQEQAADPGGWPYCLHLRHYAPRCTSCHRIYDNRLRPDRVGATFGEADA